MSNLSRTWSTAGSKEDPVICCPIAPGLMDVCRGGFLRGSVAKVQFSSVLWHFWELRTGLTALRQNWESNGTELVRTVLSCSVQFSSQFELPNWLKKMIISSRHEENVCNGCDASHLTFGLFTFPYPLSSIYLKKIMRTSALTRIMRPPSLRVHFSLRKPPSSVSIKRPMYLLSSPVNPVVQTVWYLLL